MKNNLLSLCVVFLSLNLVAQVDTVFYEGFQSNPFPAMDTVYTGSNDNWVNFDQDDLVTNSQTLESKRWYSGAAISDPIDPVTGQIDFVAISLSFLQNSAPGNRNWMILPPLNITDDTYMLHWESAPGQLPRYQDGYQVLISVNGNDIENEFTDTLFTAASMDAIVGDGQSTDYSNFSFTPGYLHANASMDSAYIETTETINYGLLEPHSIDLSAYSGKTVYIAFLHDSDDDERLTVDDILLTKQADVSSTDGSNINRYRVEIYPNPVRTFVNLNYSLETQKDNVFYSVLNVNGESISKVALGGKPAGTHTEKISMQNFVSGTYFIQLNIDGEQSIHSVIKR